MTFLIGFLVYLVAFVIGAAIMWLILKALHPATDPDGAFTDHSEGARK